MSTYVRRFLVFIFNDQPTIGWNVLRRAIYIPVIFYISYLVGTKQRKLFESGRHDYRTPQCLGGKCLLQLHWNFCCNQLKI